MMSGNWPYFILLALTLQAVGCIGTFVSLAEKRKQTKLSDLSIYYLKQIADELRWKTQLDASVLESGNQIKSFNLGSSEKMRLKQLVSGLKSYLFCKVQMSCPVDPKLYAATKLLLDKTNLVLRQIERAFDLSPIKE